MMTKLADTAIYHMGKLFARIYARLALSATDDTVLCIDPLSRFPMTWRDVFAQASAQANPDCSPCTARGDALQMWAQWFGVDLSGTDEEIQERIRERLIDPVGTEVDDET